MFAHCEICNDIKLRQFCFVPIIHARTNEISYITDKYLYKVSTVRNK